MDKKAIAEQYIEERFPEAMDSYKNEWKERFKLGMEWQKSDLSGRRILQSLAPDYYPKNIQSYFMPSNN